MSVGFATILLTFIVATLRATTPLLLAALGGVFSERAGVVNIALEGIMLSGAWAAAYFSFISGSAWVGLLGAVAVGVAMAGLHAVASIKYYADQVVSGTAINLLAVGFTEFMLNRVWGQAGGSPEVASLPNIFGLNLMIYLAFILAFVSWVALYRTPWGLRLRSVGEHPLAADTLGINVFRIRYYCTFLGGLVAGFAGAYFTLGSVGRFDEVMTAGRGFIALVAVIFGRAHPTGVLLASLLFGVIDALGIRLQGAGLPSQVTGLLPFVVTLLTLVALRGRGLNRQGTA